MMYNQLAQGYQQTAPENPYSVIVSLTGFLDKIVTEPRDSVRRLSVNNIWIRVKGKERDLLWSYTGTRRVTLKDTHTIIVNHRSPINMDIKAVKNIWVVFALGILTLLGIISLIIVGVTVVREYDLAKNFEPTSCTLRNIEDLGTKTCQYCYTTYTRLW